jgi:hypothetical protein
MSSLSAEGRSFSNIAKTTNSSDKYHKWFKTDLTQSSAADLFSLANIFINDGNFRSDDGAADARRDYKNASV